MSTTRIPESAPTVAILRTLGEAAGREVAAREVAVEPEEHAARPLGPVEGCGRRDAVDLLRVAALVHAVLGPRARVVLRARDLDEGHVARRREPVHAVAVGVAGEIAGEVVTTRDQRRERLARVGREPEVVGGAHRRVDRPHVVVAEDEDRTARLEGEVVEPLQLVARDLASDTAGDHRVEHRERDPADLHAYGAPSMARVGSSIASWLPRTNASRSPKTP